MYIIHYHISGPGHNDNNDNNNNNNNQTTTNNQTNNKCVWGSLQVKGKIKKKKKKKKNQIIDRKFDEISNGFERKIQFIKQKT